MSIASLFSMLGRLRFSIPHPCKKTIYLLFGLSLPFLCAAQTTQEQQTTVVADTTIHVEKKNFGQRLKQIITQLNTIDTTYIQPNDYTWTAMMQNTNFLHFVSFSATEKNKERQSLTFFPRPSFKIGPFLGWRWLFLGYTIDIGRIQKAGKNTEFSLSLYSNLVGGDFVYLKNKGDFQLQRTVGFQGVSPGTFHNKNFDGLQMYLISFNLYCIFNHKKFSYPAAYNQSTIQRKSAGTLLFGSRYDHQKLEFDYTKLPPTLTQQTPLFEQLKIANRTYSNYSISAGYAYNWAFARDCLLAGSFTPTIGLSLERGRKVAGTKPDAQAANLNLGFVGRVGLVWNTGRGFVGISYISQLYDYRRKGFTAINSVNFINTYAGFYFGK